VFRLGYPLYVRMYSFAMSLLSVMLSAISPMFLIAVMSAMLEMFVIYSLFVISVMWRCRDIRGAFLIHAINLNLLLHMAGGPAHGLILGCGPQHCARLCTVLQY
jgi:hypothetical protein